MRPNVHVHESSLLKPLAVTVRARVVHDSRRRIRVRRSHLLLTVLAATFIALVALPGWGTGAQASCGGTALMTEFACVDGQFPQSHPGRECVIDSSVYGTNYWRCAFEN